mmetsp:Transcript_35701/g.100383  ORF Transcript_35701/g.100383 Transcript_35701/m.100383 type:complete len:297 (-) Transcript_35701:816-1706(-)
MVGTIGAATMGGHVKCREFWKIMENGCKNCSLGKLHEIHRRCGCRNATTMQHGRAPSPAHCGAALTQATHARSRLKNHRHHIEKLGGVQLPRTIGPTIDHEETVTEHHSYAIFAPRSHARARHKFHSRQVQHFSRVKCVSTVEATDYHQSGVVDHDRRAPTPLGTHARPGLESHRRQVKHLRRVMPLLPVRAPGDPTADHEEPPFIDRGHRAQVPRCPHSRPRHHPHRGQVEHFSHARLEQAAATPEHQHNTLLKHRRHKAPALCLHAWPGHMLHRGNVEYAGAAVDCCGVAVAGY